MKLNTLRFFNDFNKRVIEGIEVCNLDKIKYEQSKEYMIQSLAPYEHYIMNFTNLDFNYLKNSVRQIPPYSIRSSASINLNLDHLRFILNAIIEVNKELKKIEDKLKWFKEANVTEDIFKTICYKFNNKISDEILYKGYTYHLGAGLGRIKIRKHITKKVRINWFESNKKRKEIEDRGGLPYAVTLRDENNKMLENNGGEFWYVYHPETDYLWHWNKVRGRAANISYYKFRPTLYNNTTRNGGLGNINKLKQLQRTNSELLKNFTD